MDNYYKHHEKRKSDQRDRYVDSKEKRRLYNAIYRAYHKDQSKQYRQENLNKYTYLSWCRRLKKKGLTPDNYFAMLEKQGGVCAICRCKHPGQKVNSSWAVDHCHKTNKVRGLLCHKCNLALGLLRDDPVLLQTAAAYLTRSF